MLVGESFGMKTASYRILQAALTDMNAAGVDEFKTKVYALNPKSITMQQLYGADDPGEYSLSISLFESVIGLFCCQMRVMEGILCLPTVATYV
jgi:hypothetical protein